jgi:hypothetical protein
MGKPRLLILTGPQGSGNHVFSKIFALHPSVFGWKSLNTTYWLGHHKEPFSRYWQHPETIGQHKWQSTRYHVTSISCPFILAGVAHVPQYQAFFSAAAKYADISLAIIGRDQNILKRQQSRVRGDVTLAVDKLPFEHAHFLSIELLYLYRSNYLQGLARQLDWPIAWDSERVENILRDDSNEKYVHAVGPTALDALVRDAIDES